MSEHHDLFPSNDDAQSVSDRLSAEALIVDVDGFEGPLDLLLTLSRTQKVDLRKISVLHLAQQYLAFVEKAKALRIELAADYLVMAAWLAGAQLCTAIDAQHRRRTGDPCARSLNSKTRLTDRSAAISLRASELLALL